MSFATPDETSRNSTRLPKRDIGIKPIADHRHFFNLESIFACNCIDDHAVRLANYEIWFAPRGSTHKSDHGSYIRHISCFRWTIKVWMCGNVRKTCAYKVA